MGIDADRDPSPLLTISEQDAHGLQQSVLCSWSERLPDPIGPQACAATGIAPLADPHVVYGAGRLDEAGLDLVQHAGLRDRFEQFGGEIRNVRTAVPQQEVTHTGGKSPLFFLLVSPALQSGFEAQDGLIDDLFAKNS